MKRTLKNFVMIILIIALAFSIYCTVNYLEKPNQPETGSSDSVPSAPATF